MGQLTESDIKVNALIWYSGFASLGEWDCPAVIYQVDDVARTFRVKSLDDMCEQDQVYDFDVDADSPLSRRTMRQASLKEVEKYLSRQEENLKTQLIHANERLKQANENFDRFRRGKNALPCLKHSSP